MANRIVVAILLLIAPAVFAGQDSMVVVQVRSLEKTSAQLEELAGALELPMPPGLVQGQIGMLAMSPELSGIDASKPITLFVGKFMMEQPQPPAVVIRFSLTDDGADYLSSVERSIPVNKEIEPGLHKFFLGDADDPATPAFFVHVEDGVASAGSSVDAINQLKDDVSEEEATLLASLPGEISALVNAAAISELVAAQIKQQKDMIEMYKAQMEAEGVDTSDLMKTDPAAGLDTVGDLMTRLLGELDLFLVNLDLSRDITLRTHVRPVEGSVLATLLDDMTAPPALISGQQIPGAWFRGYGTMAGIDRILEPYAEWVSTMYRELGPPFDTFAGQYREMVLGMKGLYSGGYNLFLLPPLPEKPLQVAGIYEINDKEAARKTMRDVMKMQEVQGAAMTNNELGYSMRVVSNNEEPYKGVEIESYTVSYDFMDDAMEAAMPMPLANLFNNMGYTLGYMDHHLVFSFGSPESTHQMIDYVLDGGAPVPQRDGFGDIPEEALGYWNLSVSGLLNAIVSMVPPELGPGPLAAVKDVEASIRGLAIKEHDGFSSLLRLTREDLKSFVAIGMSMAPKGNQGMMPADEGMMEDMPADMESPADDDEAMPAE